MARWLEISADYACNNRCVGCFSVADGGPSMDGRELTEQLRAGRAAGAEWLWLGGGEPTMRRDLFAIVRAARKLGYRRVKLQTNAMMLASPGFAARCADEGVTEINLSIKGATAETHDRLAQTPGCFDLMLQGVEAWRGRGPIVGDVLAYRSNVDELPAIVRRFFALGVEKFWVWTLSASDSALPEVAAEVPRLADVVRNVQAAMDLALSPRADFITSLHTPPCTVPASHRGCLFFAADLGLLVANPGGHRFLLETSPMEGGLYLEGCATCSMRARCGGLRADYVALHGDAEFRPVP